MPAVPVGRYDDRPVVERPNRKTAVAQRRHRSVPGKGAERGDEREPPRVVHAGTVRQPRTIVRKRNFRTVPPPLGFELAQQGAIFQIPDLPRPGGKTAVFADRKKVHLGQFTFELDPAHRIASLPVPEFHAAVAGGGDQERLVPRSPPSGDRSRIGAPFLLTCAGAPDRQLAAIQHAGDEFAAFAQEEDRADGAAPTFLPVSRDDFTVEVDHLHRPLAVADGDAVACRRNVSVFHVAEPCAE